VDGQLHEAQLNQFCSTFLFARLHHSRRCSEDRRFQRVSHRENIKKAMNETATQFGLQYKKVIFVTDQGENVVKACKLAGAERFAGVAHGLHNLIIVDGIGKCNTVQNIISRVKDIVKTFTFKVAMWEQEAEDMGREQVLDDIEKIFALMEAEEEADTNGRQDPGEELVDDVEIITSESCSASSNRPTMTSLKKDCPTRWCTDCA
jgi:hypothetical protein